MPLNPVGNWYQQFMPNLNGRTIVDITFTDSLTGYAVTNNLSVADTGYILKTTNSGDNWIFSFIVNRGFTAIEFINMTTGYACGGSGGGTTYLCKTTNAGINWSLVNSPSTAKWDDMHVLSNDTIWLVEDDGFAGGVFFSSDGGLNWHRQLDLGNQNPEKIYMYNARIGFVTRINSGSPYIRRTSDGGQSWQIIVSNQAYRDIYFSDSLKGWRAWGNSMYMTTNSGISWITQLLPAGGNIITTGIYEFSNINQDTIIGAGGWVQYPNGQARGILYRTINGGKNWQYQVPDTSINIFQYYFLQFLNKRIGWAYSVTNGIHTTDGGEINWITPIEGIYTEIPLEFKLFQNYPNPFNAMTKLKFQMSKQGYAVIKLFDVRGREVSVIFNESLDIGEYEVVLNANNYSNGVYFYRLTVTTGKEVFTETKKMLMIK